MRVNILCETKEIQTEQGDNLILEYYLIHDMAAGSAEEERYGIGILKKEEDGTEEREWLSGISNSREKTESLLMRMAAGMVTPVSAAAIVDDWIGADEKLG